MSSNLENQALVHASTSASVSAEGSSRDEPLTAPTLKKSPSRVLRDICSRPDIKSTENLIREYNETPNEDERAVLHEWLERYVEWFKKNAANKCKDGIYMEYASLAQIKPLNPQSKTLVKKAFLACGDHVIHQTFSDEESVIALGYALQQIEPSVFDGDVSNLLKLATGLLFMLDPSYITLTEGTYESQQHTLVALRLLFLLIQKVAPGQLHPTHSEGVYHSFKEQLMKIKNNQAYYPIYFEAQFLEQALHRLTADPRLESTDVFRRLLYAGAGCAYFWSAARQSLFANIDIEAIEKGCLRFQKARRGLEADKRQWYEELISLDASAMLACEDPDNFDSFRQQCDELLRLQQYMSVEEDKKLLRFGIIRLHHFLAVDGSTEAIRKSACEELVYFVSRYVHYEDWSQPEIVEELFRALHDINAREELADTSFLAFEIATSSGDEKVKEIVEKVSQGRHQTSYTMKQETECSSANHLFDAIRSTIGTVYTHEDVLQREKELKQLYLEDDFVMVPFLMDENEGMHIDSFEHSVVVYTKPKDDTEEKQASELGGYNRRTNRTMEDHVVARHMRELREKTPVSLEDVFRFQTTTGETREVRKILLISDPGVGKTSIAKKIAHRWSVGNWPTPLNAVYLIPLRKVRKTDYATLGMYPENLLETAIARLHFPRHSVEKHQCLLAQINDTLSDSETLLIIDGIDESDECGKRVISDALKMEMKLLLLSRPYNLGNVPNLVGRTLECLGMDEKQLVTFFTNALPENEGATLIQHLKMEPVTWQLAHVPVTAQIARLVWKETKDRETQIFGGTLYTIYSKMVNCVWWRYVDKCGGTNIDRDDVFDALGLVAFYSLQRGQILIEQGLVLHLVSKNEIKKAFKESGLLLLRMEGDQYQFPHLSFQEYFAARMISRQLQKKKEKEQVSKFLARHKYEDRYKNMLTFAMQAVCAIDSCQGFMAMKQALCTSPIEMLGVRHLLLELRLFEACFSTKDCGLEDEVGFAEISNVVRCTTKLIKAFVKDVPTIGNIERELETLPRTLEAFPDVFDALFEGMKEQLVQQRLDVALRLTEKSSSLAQKAMGITLHILNRCEDVEKFKAVSYLQGMIRGRPELLDGTIGTIIDCCRDKDDSVRTKAIEILIDVLKICPELLERLTGTIIDGCYDKCNAVSRKALSAFGDVVNELPEGMISDIVDGLRDKDGTERGQAFQVLYQVVKLSQELSDEMIVVVVDGCRDTDMRVRESAFNVLGQVVQTCPKLSEEVIDTIRDGCHDKSERMRQCALQALGKIAIVHQQPLDEMTNTIGTIASRWVHDWTTRQTALRTIREIATSRPELSEGIAAAVVNACCGTHWTMSFSRLKDLGEAAKACPEVFEQVMYDLCRGEEPHVRRNAFVALREFVEARLKFSDRTINTIIDGCCADHVRKEASIALVEVLKKCPDLTDRMIDTILDRCQDEAEFARCGTLEVIHRVVRAGRELSNRAIGTIIRQGRVQSFLNKSKTYEVLDQIVTSKQELSDWLIGGIIDLCNEGNVNRDSAFETLCRMVKAHPELSERLSSTIAEGYNDKEWQVQLPPPRTLGQSLENPGLLDRMVLTILDGCNDDNGKVLFSANQIVVQVAEAGAGLFDWAISKLVAKCHDGTESALYVLDRIVREKPKLSDKAISAITDLYLVENIDRTQVCTVLCEIAKARFEVSERVFDIIVQGSREVSNTMRWRLFVQLTVMAEECPELAERAFQVIVGSCHDPDETVRSQVLSGLGRIAKACPGLLESALDVMTEMYGREESPCILDEAYVLPIIAEKRPDLSKEVFGLVAKKSRNECCNTRRDAFWELGDLVKVCPELAEQALHVIANDCSDTDDLL